MATTLVPAQPQPQSQPVESNTTSDRTDYIVGYLLKDKDGKLLEAKVPAFYPVSSEEEITFVTKKKDDGSFSPIFQVTTSIPKAKNAAGMIEICPDEEERANNFNRGAKQKANNRLKARLLEVDEDGNLVFDPSGVDKEGKSILTNGVLDMTADIASPSKRKVRTEEEKLDEFLEQFPEATRNMMKQAYLASRQAPAA